MLLGVIHSMIKPHLLQWSFTQVRAPTACFSNPRPENIRFPSAPLLGYTNSHGPIAQWLEQGTHNSLVPGSNPGGPTPFAD